MNEREVLGGLALITNEQTAEAFVPAVGSFDDPAAGLSANAAHERRFSWTSNVRDHATIADLRPVPGLNPLNLLALPTSAFWHGTRSVAEELQQIGLRQRDAGSATPETDPVYFVMISIVERSTIHACSRRPSASYDAVGVASGSLIAVTGIWRVSIQPSRLARETAPTKWVSRISTTTAPAVTSPGPMLFRSRAALWQPGSASSEACAIPLAQHRTSLATSPVPPRKSQ